MKRRAMETNGQCGTMGLTESTKTIGYSIRLPKNIAMRLHACAMIRRIIFHRRENEEWISRNESRRSWRPRGQREKIIIQRTSLLLEHSSEPNEDASVRLFLNLQHGGYIYPSTHSRGACENEKFPLAIIGARHRKSRRVDGTGGRS